MDDNEDVVISGTEADVEMGDVKKNDGLCHELYGMVANIEDLFHLIASDDDIQNVDDLGDEAYMYMFETVNVYMRDNEVRPRLANRYFGKDHKMFIGIDPLIYGMEKQMDGMIREYMEQIFKGDIKYQDIFRYTSKDEYCDEDGSYRDDGRDDVDDDGGDDGDDGDIDEID